METRSMKRLRLLGALGESEANTNVRLPAHLLTKPSAL